MAVNTAQSSVMLSLPQMVDLALTSPDPGVVNFNLLHDLLHVMIQQLDLLQCKVEFRGEGGEKIQKALQQTNNVPTINLTEYVVSPEKEAGKKVQRGKRRKKDAPKNDKEVTADDLEATSMETVVVVEPMDADGNIQVPHVSVAISRTQIDDMAGEITKMKGKIKDLTDLPKNKGLMDAVRNNEGATPVLDMFQILSLSKRIDAAEIVMEKLASMMEDVLKKKSIRNSSSSSLASKKRKSSVDSTAPVRSASQITSQVLSQETGTQDPSTSAKKSSQTKTFTKSDATAMTEKFKKMTPENAIPALVEEINKLKKNVEQIMKGGGTPASEKIEKSVAKNTKEYETSPKPTGQSKSVGRKEEMTDNTDSNLAQLYEDVRIIKDKLSGNKKKDKEVESGADFDLPPEVRLSELEDRFGEYYDQLVSMDGNFNNEILTLHNQFTDLEKDFNNIISRMQGSFPAGDETMNQAGENVNEVYKKLVKLQDDIEQVAETASTLLDDKAEKEKFMDSLLEQIELLKTIKADREDIEDALANKADACAVNRKVSHDQFDTACDELSKGIEEALAKLTTQESLWQQALDDIQNEIGTKLDKMDLGPLREFVNNKLKMLQERMKALAALRKDQEAAGTKSKFLRNVNCISCDKDVVMRKEMDPALRPQAYSAPPRRSMGPYLAYELDALRKQQKQLPGGRNLNHFENALNAGKSPRKDEDHICNRYCGGSHTVTTPQQRVTRLGHFLQQWGPEAVPQSEPVEKRESKTVNQQPKKLSMNLGSPSMEITGSKKGSMDNIDKNRSKTHSKQSVKSALNMSGEFGDNAKKGSVSSTRAPSQTSALKGRISVTKGQDKNNNIPEETQSQLAAEEATAVFEEDEGGEEVPKSDASMGELELTSVELVPEADAPPGAEVPADEGEAPPADDAVEEAAPPAE